MEQICTPNMDLFVPDPYCKNQAHIKYNLHNQLLV